MTSGSTSGCRGPSALPTLRTWRSLRFFDAVPLQEEMYDDAMAGVSCVAYAPKSSGPWASPRGALVTGLHSGQIRVVDARTFVELASWKAFDHECMQVHVASEHGAILTMGCDDDTNVSTVRVWRLDSTAANAWQAVLCACVMVDAHITCAAVPSHLSDVALGLGDGRVYVLHALSDSMHAKEPHIIKPKLAREASFVDESTEPDVVTGLVIDASTLLIATVSCTLKFTLHGPRAGQAPSVIDTIGCPPRCGAAFRTCAATEAKDGVVPSVSAPKLVLAREEALYVIGSRGRETSFALEGIKRSIHTLHGQLVIVMLDRILVFDLDTKCITYADEYRNVGHIWTNEAECIPDEYIHLHHARMRLVAKPLVARLEHLFSVHLYIQAIPFIYAYAARYPHARLPSLPSSASTMPLQTRPSPVELLVADAYRRFGEHLYARGDFENAMQQFCHTIGIMSPSVVIRKFLDAQRLQYLTVYLEALHARHLAHTGHATLLLNCYTKLRNIEAVDRFLRASDVPLDVPVALDVCRRGGCVAQAAYLAQVHGMHDVYLSIQLHDADDPKAALDYLASLPHSDVMRYFHLCARKLLDAEAGATMDLLVRVYTAESATVSTGDFQVLLSHFVGHPRLLEHFLERIRDACADASRKPDFFVLAQDTLLELYLAHTPDKALHVLEGDASLYTPSRALIFCAKARYTPGLLRVYERLGMVDAILQHWIHAGDSERVLRTLERYGATHAQLYGPTLSFFTSTHELFAQHREAVERIVQHVLQHALFSPIELVELLSRNDVAPLGLLTPHLVAHMEQEQAELSAARKLVASYRTEARAKQTELAALQSSDEPRIFQHERCELCHQALDLPCVHFMCRHSFHVRCLLEGERTRECPVCAAEHTTIETLRDVSPLTSLDAVLDEVRAADDEDGRGFDVLADLFAKGIDAGQQA